MKPARGLTRRRFVVVAAASATAGGGLALGIAPARAAAARPALVQPFLRIGLDGTVTVLAKHLDMGQGIWTGLASIVAEELDAAWAQMRVEGAPADKAVYKNLLFGFQTTGGSTSTANSWEQLRRAGAIARAMLVAAAAKRFGVAPGAVSIEAGVVRGGGRSAGFGELAALAAALPVPAEAPLKDPARFRLVGHASPRLDAFAKTHGAPLFGIDVERPGMRVALVQRAPRFGAVVRRFDAAAARAVPGVIDVARIPSGLAVVAEHTWAAMEGRRALVVEWEEAAAESRSAEALAEAFRQAAASDAGIVCFERGDLGAGFAGAARVVEAVFEAPYLAHAPMEPLCAVGEWRPGRGCEVWAGIQNQSGDQAALARILGLELGQVTLHTLYAGGSFGRRATFDSDWIGELGHLLAATGGAYPVKLMWTREDDVRGGYYRPLNVHRVRAAVGADGGLLAVDHAIAAQSFLFGRPRPGAVPRPDPFVFEGHLASRYDVAAARVRWVDVDSPIPVQMYRALAYNHTTFAKEVLVDELARASGRDPLEYRLAHLAGHPRQAAVLRLAAERAGWPGRAAAGTALGLAVQQANNGTFIAQVAEVRLGEEGAPRVVRVVCAVDCGLVVNPDIARAQVEGGVAFGLSIALHGRITVEAGRTVQSNFHDYKVLRLPDMPATVEVHFLPGGGPPTGIGEPGSVPIVAAVANAYAVLTGKVVRSLPLPG